MLARDGVAANKALKPGVASPWQDRAVQNAFKRLVRVEFGLDHWQKGLKHGHRSLTHSNNYDPPELPQKIGSIANAKDRIAAGDLLLHCLGDAHPLQRLKKKICRGCP